MNRTSQDMAQVRYPENMHSRHYSNHISLNTKSLSSTVQTS